MQAHAPLAPAELKVEDRLVGRRIIVTGAASGVGRSVAELFLRAGARVAALDRHRPEDLPGKVLCLEADVTDPDAVERAVAAAASAFGGLDGLVNAAGIANTGAYAASKAGVISLTRSLAMREQVGPRYALGRIGEPLEIALAALYLSSAESSFVTGIVLAVDGGRSYH
ncbi:SDR family oxidoreductase [Variovorax sp. J22G21]|uniref:SDR family NAD(P)-dependent oxidoreductase n=1 Tax=Variovorax fucosicus TaxID=3053517 RepID=UPI002575DCC2|nr:MULTISPECIES: SDR family oxidoreductase [unclassified Variovorax]MDM0041342.1 SDR family oxidoreductase [Variovorax sp. J22R193]MDM0060399.1 SDR family oxidoreductase [Variovorax sp. J22G21]